MLGDAFYAAGRRLQTLLLRIRLEILYADINRTLSGMHKGVKRLRRLSDRICEEERRIRSMKNKGW